MHTRQNSAARLVWSLVCVSLAFGVAAPHTRAAACCGSAPEPEAVPPTAATNAAPPAVATTNAAPMATNALPRLVDLGAGKCIPCKLMAPILDELKSNYVGRLEVQFIDVWKNPEAGKPYQIKVIPTQIFLGADGKEKFRHEGFYSREDILAKWKELGVELK
jgi:thioredoxin 1